jgi:hypothetical protein
MGFDCNTLNDRAAARRLHFDNVRAGLSVDKCRSRSDAMIRNYSIDRSAPGVDSQCSIERADLRP